MMNDQNVYRKMAEFLNSISTKNELFQLQVTKEDIKKIYMRHIPKTPIYKKRPVWDCNTCKHFIFKIAGLSVVQDGNLLPVFKIFSQQYQFDKEIAFLKLMFADIVSLTEQASPTFFTTKEAKFGCERNLSNNNEVFSHFYYNVPTKYIKRDISDQVKKLTSLKALCSKYIKHINILEETKSYIKYLYRGEQYLHVLNNLITLLKSAKQSKNIDVFCLQKACSEKFVPAIGNVIFTLVNDLIKMVNPEDAIKSFNIKTAPCNYRQPKIEVITKQELVELQKTLQDFNMKDFQNSFSFPERLPLKNILWTNMADKKSGLEALLEDNIKSKMPKKSTKIGLNELLCLLPKAQEVEIGKSLEKVALIKSKYPDFYFWRNRYGWSYESGLADSDYVSNQVKAQGGDIDAKIRFSLYWENFDDLDLHLIGPKAHIYYQHKNPPMSNFYLDIDMNVDNPVRGAIENIIAKRPTKMDNGKYRLKVCNYKKREAPCNCIVCVYVDNELLYQFDLQSPVDGICQPIMDFNLFDGKIEPIQIFASTSVANDPTRLTYKRIHTIAFSPNCWEDKVVGLKHLFFFAEKETIDFNALKPFNVEQIDSRLLTHKRALNALSKKIKVIGAPQLVGYGVSFAKPRTIQIRLDKRPYTLNI